MCLPESITLIRHATTVFQEFAKKKKKDQLYLQFRKAWEQNPLSTRTIELAKRVRDTFIFGYSDAETPLAEDCDRVAERTGTVLKGTHPLPDIIYATPYIRTGQTLERLYEGWPELKGVRVISDELIREQEKGLKSIYSDRRIMFTLHPEQIRFYDVMGQYWYRYPQGESTSDVRLRVQIWLNQLASCFPGKRVLVVAHYVSIAAVVANFKGFNDAQFVDFFIKQPLDTCGVTIFKNDSGDRINMAILPTLFVY